MKARINARGVLALAAASAVAVTGVLVAPAHAATKTTVVMTEPSPLTSLQYNATDMNLNTNLDVTYPTGFGFWYADNQKNLVNNTKFGSYKIVKNLSNDFEVAYTAKSTSAGSISTKTISAHFHSC